MKKDETDNQGKGRKEGGILCDLYVNFSHFVGMWLGDRKAR